MNLINDDYGDGIEIWS